MKNSITKLIDTIILQILKIEDYLCLPRDVRASEVGLLFLSITWFIWLVIFDVEHSGPAFSYIFSEAGWACIFGAFSVLHLAGLWIPAIQVRQLAVTGYAVQWFVWLVILSYARISSPIVPTVLVIELIAIYVAVKVSRHSEETNA